MELKDALAKKSSFDSPAEEAYLNLSRTFGFFSNDVGHLFKSHGLSQPTYNILRILRGVHRMPFKGQRCLPCNEIAQRMLTPVPDLTRLMDRLDKAGLIDRQRSEEDRRVVFIAITQAGLQLLKKIDKPLNDMHRSNFSHMSAKQLQQLNELLTLARQNYEGRN